jgi:purine-binding chemotaxis protein CheW
MLLARAGGRVCALSLEHVVETMRPRPTSALSGTPAFVRGVAVIRGEPTPVVDLAELLGAAGAPATRFVVVRAAERLVALAVEDVVGIVPREAATGGTLAPLLAELREGAVDRLGTLDRELLVVLDAARLMPAEVWSSLARARDER